jgi:hypothetical protein
VAPAEARVTVLGDVVLGDAEDLTDLDAGPDRLARPVVRLLKYPKRRSAAGFTFPYTNVRPPSPR